MSKRTCGFDGGLRTGAGTLYAASRSRVRCACCMHRRRRISGTIPLCARRDGGRVARAGSVPRVSAVSLAVAKTGERSGCRSSSRARRKEDCLSPEEQPLALWPPAPRGKLGPKTAVSDEMLVAEIWGGLPRSIARGKWTIFARSKSSWNALRQIYGIPRGDISTWRLPTPTVLCNW
jgi:hypothetical protein